MGDEQNESGCVGDQGIKSTVCADSGKETGDESAGKCGETESPEGCKSLGKALAL